MNSLTIPTKVIEKEEDSSFNLLTTHCIKERTIQREKPSKESMLHVVDQERAKPPFFETSSQKERCQ